jgi:hypothetical protein
MRKSLCLALPVLLVAACGDAGDSSPEKTDAAPDVGKTDTALPNPDVPANLDLYVAPAPDAPADLPPSPDLPTTPVDGPPRTIDGPTWTIDWDVPNRQGVDGPAVNIDVPEPVDGPSVDHYDFDVPGPRVDGPASPTDVTTRTLYSPDGRTWTVIMVAACQSGSQPDTTRCPATYDEGLAKVRAVDGGGAFTQTKAGRCSEGSYVYFPYFGTSSIGCYYDASSQRLVASAQHEDTIIECGKDGTASFTIASGAYPPCTQTTWEATSPL